jgi:hypothetical protein
MTRSWGPSKRSPSFREKEKDVKPDRPTTPEEVKSHAPDVEDPVMSMAIRFKELAYENRVMIEGKFVSAAYLAAIFRDPVAQSGMLTRKYHDGDGKPVSHGKVGRNVVRMFWDRAPWDRDGDIVRQFADPVMFEECLKAVVERWKCRYIHNQLVKAGKVKEGNRG